MTAALVILAVIALFFLWRRFLSPAARPVVVNGTRILVSSLGREAGGWLEEGDAGAYSKFYRNVEVARAQDADALLASVAGGGYDVVHLFCEIDANGRLVVDDDSRLRGGDLLEACGRGGVELLFIARDNPGEHYSLAFGAAAARLDLAMTIERKGERFRPFLEELLQKMSAGATVPMAWVAVAPQVPNPPPGSPLLNHPGVILMMNGGRAKLLP